MRAHTGVDFDDIDRVEGKGIAVAKKIDEQLAAISPAVHGIHDDGRVQKIDGVTPPLVKYCTLRAKEGPPQGPALGPFSGNAVFLPLTLLRQAERSVNTWRLHAGNSSASQFVSTPGRLAHARVRDIEVEIPATPLEPPDRGTSAPSAFICVHLRPDVLFFRPNAKTKTRHWPRDKKQARRKFS